MAGSYPGHAADRQKQRTRIAAAAEGGEILASLGVRELCAGKGFPFADRGEFVVKGFEEPVRMFQVVITGGGFTAANWGCEMGLSRSAWPCDPLEECVRSLSTIHT